MHAGSRYELDISPAPGEAIAASAEWIFDAVWRFDFSTPGFCLLELGPAIGSHQLRALMLEIQERLDEVAGRRGIARFAYRSLSRFDQQVTTKFHRDGAPDQSLLILGYEPSKVRSRVALADYVRCAFDLGIEPGRFLDEFNPMYRKGEVLLAPYVTALPQPGEGHSRILLINNSSLPYGEARANPLGVLHTAEILGPDSSERRVVNSIMLVNDDHDAVDDDALRTFVATEEISQARYGEEPR